MDNTHFGTQRKAGDAAYWNNFTHQHDKDFEPVGVVHGADDNFVLLPLSELKEMEIPLLEMPKDYKSFGYPHMQAIKIDRDPLKHWSDIFGAFSVIPTQYLMFIQESKLPLEQIVKYELAARGIGKKGKWIGFDQAERLWFGTNH